MSSQLLSKDRFAEIKMLDEYKGSMFPCKLSFSPDLCKNYKLFCKFFDTMTSQDTTA